MSQLFLAGRHDKVVEIDHCGGCRLVWFDALESVQLAGLGWVSLLRVLQEGVGLALAPGGREPPACPHCANPLKTVYNQTRFGQFVALECAQGHGHLHSHSGLLAERGLVRSLLPAERARLLAFSHHLECLNCGAPADGKSDSCRYCNSPLVLLDLERLAHALTFSPHDAAPRSEGLPLAWPCAACGSPLNPSRQAQCPACAQAVVTPSLLDIAPLLDSAQALLADAATERLLKAARMREQWQQRPARKRDWRDTQLARLQRFAEPEGRVPRQALLELLLQLFTNWGSQPQKLGAVLLLVLLLLVFR